MGSYALFMDDFSRKKFLAISIKMDAMLTKISPPLGFWNLTRLAETLLPLFDSDTKKAIPIAEEILREFNASTMNTGFRAWEKKLA